MRKLFDVSRFFSEQVNNKHIGAYASSAAFFMFLSFIPIMILLCSIIPYTPITESRLMGVLVDILPKTLESVSVSIVAEMYDKSPTIISISAIATIWSAARGMFALIRGLNVINEVDETRNYFLLRLKACLYTVIFLVAIVVTLVVMVFGKVIVEAIVEAIPNAKVVTEFFLSIRFIVSIFFLMLFFVFLYSFLPNEKMHVKRQIPGAVFTSIIWVVFSWGFSFYVSAFSTFDMYGSLSTMIVIMIWMYICMYILLVGALINRFLYG